jgi:hypothetical protein
MKADLTRDTFDQRRHFLRVLMQQGRVQVDADPNEQASILLHRLHVLAADLIGSHGGPAENLGFALARKGTDLRIGPGHYYVDGLLCELEPAPARSDESGATDGSISYFEQPDYPRDPDDDKLPNPPFVAYLDVWEWHVTAIDDEHIREVALGGPDTSTRSKLVWQVKVEPVDATTKEALLKLWQNLVEKWQPADRGALAAGTDDPVDETDPCITPPASGYRGAENQLYRVEIVVSGTVADGDARFVWSRENGSVVSGWDQSGDAVALVDPGRDRKLGFDAGQWVELTDDVTELTAAERQLREVTEVEDGVLTLAGDDVDPDLFKVHPKIRRWDSDGLRTVERPAASDGWIPLEDGIRIRFSETGRYRAGDYWLIPARVLGGLEWPAGRDGPIALPPHGIQHHFAPLALFVQPTGTTQPIDCRRSFAPLAK